MRVRVSHIVLVVTLMVVSAGVLHAQKYPERKSIRSGNRAYEQGAYPESEVDYRRALEKNPESYEAQFNLGNALYKQERHDEAAQIFQQLAQDTTHADHAAACHYNAGNALFGQRKLQEALEAYKNSLRANPADMDAKFNLAYVKKMLEDQQGDGGGGGENNNKNQDQNKDQSQDQQQGDQNKDNQQDKGGDKQDKGDQDQNQNGNEDKPQQGQPPQQQGMTAAAAQQMLDAMQAQEDRTQDKVDEKKKGVVVGSRSGRNW